MSDKQDVTLYKEFIDDLVRISHDVMSTRVVTGKGWPDTEENKPINKVLQELSTDQKEVIAQLLQQSRQSGIHDFLVYLTDERLQIVKDGIPIALEPFGTEMYWDWVCRREGDPWPDSEEE